MDKILIELLVRHIQNRYIYIYIYNRKREYKRSTISLKLNYFKKNKHP